MNFYLSSRLVSDVRKMIFRRILERKYRIDKKVEIGKIHPLREEYKIVGKKVY